MLTATVSAKAGGAAFGTQLVDVAVDIDTGKVDILRYTAAQDVGTAIHPSYVEGQIQGGVAQGVGWALNEEYFYDADGRMRNATFLDYRMPTCLDLPMIDCLLVEVPESASSVRRAGCRRGSDCSSAGRRGGGGVRCDRSAAVRTADVAGESCPGNRLFRRDLPILWQRPWSRWDELPPRHEFLAFDVGSRLVPRARRSVSSE